MKKYNKDIGNYGESLALEFLKKNNYDIICRNFRTRNGEIDIICKFKDIIVIIEVKSRYSYTFGLPNEAVTYLKQKQIISMSKYFLIKNKLFNYNCRFDVIEIYFNKNNNLYDINHLKDAFRLY